MLEIRKVSDDRTEYKHPSGEWMLVPWPVADEIERLRIENEDLWKELDAYRSDAAALMRRVAELEQTI